jgi:hypothetical protein
MEKLNEIRKIAMLVTETKLEQLRMEEELLVSFVKKKSVQLKDKQKALVRIKEINKHQLTMLGEKL